MWKWVVAGVFVLGLLLCVGTAGGGGWWYYKRVLADRQAAEQLELERVRAEAEVAAARDAQVAKDASLAQARTAAGSGDARSIVDGYSAVLDAEPANLEALLGRAKALAALDRYMEAEADLQTLVRLEPNNAEAWEALAWVLGHTSQDAEAVAALDALLKLNASNAKAWRDRANAHFRTGDLPAARADAARSCELGFTEGCALEDRLQAAARR